MFLLHSEQISAMTSKDAPRGTVESVAGPGLMGTYKLVTIRRAHLPKHEVILSKAEARKILHIPSSRPWIEDQEVNSLISNEIG
jgi:hypothetical protein